MKQILHHLVGLCSNSSLVADWTGNDTVVALVLVLVPYLHLYLCLYLCNETMVVLVLYLHLYLCNNSSLLVADCPGNDTVGVSGLRCFIPPPVVELRAHQAILGPQTTLPRNCLRIALELPKSFLRVTSESPRSYLRFTFPSSACGPIRLYLGHRPRYL